MTSVACPRVGDAYDRFIRWNRARLEQALRQFAGANEQAPHPGVIWADAIAADVIHATGLDVQSAVITTNAACTLSLSRHSLLPATVRVTALVSLDDANLERIARNHARKGILDACDQAAAWRQSLHVVARKGKPRFPAWDPAIMKTLAAAAGVPPIRLEPDAPDRLLHLPFEAHRFFTKTFTLHSWHRAMVVSQQGRIFLAAGHARIEDAVQEALYHCRRAAGGNGFAAAPKTACILFAKDDEVVFRDS